MSESNRKHGALIYDESIDRIDIRFDLDDYYGGLHCGECFEVRIKNKWIPTSIEKASDWFLVGVKTKFLIGLQVRI